MFTSIYSPDSLSPEELDRYLSIGWFRMTQSIFSCRFLCFHSKLYSAVWTRLNLKNHSFKKSQKKIIRKVHRDFTVIVQPALINEEKEILYQIHRKRFEGYVAKSLTNSLLGDANSSIYDTWEIGIYKEEKLIGASFFDLGNNSIASIMGIFDPEYSSYSLGYFTMLEEMSFGMNNGFLFYYPGYVVPGYQKFDYKLRIGNLEYYNFKNESWFLYNTIQFPNLPAERLISSLSLIRQLLLLEDISSTLLLYPHYDKYWYGLDAIFAVEQPLVLSCFDSDRFDQGIIVEYDIRTEEYNICKVNINREESDYLEYLSKFYDPSECMLNFLFRDEILLTNKNPQNIVGNIKSLLREKLFSN